MDIKVLDCTLRDGGYVNNWAFSREEYNCIISCLETAGIDCIEVGIMGRDDSTEFNTKYSAYNEIPPIARESHKNILFTVMTTVGEAESIPIPAKGEESVDAIRIAFFKQDIDKMTVLAKNVRDKGYQVFLQAMATYMYDSDELENLIVTVNQLEGVSALYLVDSFGTLYPDDVKKRCLEIDSLLESDIALGFHAHNNLQLALANDIAFLEIMSSSPRNNVYLDATIYGMGRGAGNTPTELLIDFLNSHYDTDYKSESVLEAYDNVISQKYTENKWGYDYVYYYSSKYRVNMVYIWYLRDILGVRDEGLIVDILSKIPEQCKYTLNKEVIRQLASEYV